MKTREKIQLFGNRDFSGNFDMSIKFIKQNFGPIVKGLAYMIPVLLIIVFLTPNLFKIYFAIGSSKYNPDAMEMLFDDYSAFTVIGAIIAYILLLTAILVMALFTIIYIAQYVKSEDGVVNTAEVWRKVPKAFLPALGGSILYGLAVLVGTLLCYIPGIIVTVYLGFYLYIYINEDLGIIDSFQRSVELIKNNFWVTLGYSLVFSFIVGMASIVFIIPFYAGLIGSMFQVEFLASELFFISTAMIFLVGYLFVYTIMYVAMGVMYYSHRNKLEGVDMETEIDNIGKFSNNPNKPY